MRLSPKIRIYGSSTIFQQSRTGLRTTKTQTNVSQERDEVVGLLRQQVELLEQELISAKEEKAKLLGLLKQRLLKSPQIKHGKSKKRDY